MSKESVINDILLHAEKLSDFIHSRDFSLIRSLNSVKFNDILLLAESERYIYFWFTALIKERVKFAKKIVKLTYTNYGKYDFEELSIKTLNNLNSMLQSTLAELETFNKRYKFLICNGSLCNNQLPLLQFVLNNSKLIVNEEKSWDELIKQMYTEWNVKW